MDRNAEFNYMLAFAVESSFENELSRDQLRCLWTAYCFHNNLDADTYPHKASLYMGRINHVRTRKAVRRMRASAA